ncbi:CoA-binding protein [Pueribacillus theae]|uniref:CoA-binding protein n=1 Tax=Pueribacillus theae TaxID=2171751 RepID=A0A2U1K031_9BACI|nr:acetate--CoA ligase family protein [Pueribacillus theae]PWA10383.1 CoA-binding protein [Pueribacillus theae]
MRKIIDLNPMFHPKSIAIIGASGGKGKIGAIPLQNLKSCGYEGDVYPVNPNYNEINGYKCYHNIESLPKNIDLAIVSVGAQNVLPSLEKLAEREIKSAVVFSSGFSEAGEEGKKLQQKLTHFSRRFKIPVCGPNSIGLFNLSNGAMATFAKLKFTQRDPVGFITQSGAFGTFTYELAKEMGLGYEYFVSTGNEAAIDFFDYVDFFAKQENLKVIGGYIEGARDLEKMESAIESAQENNKPLVMMKVGNSKKGAEAAASHTSSLAGNQSVYESFFRQKNVVQVSDEEELLDTLTIFTKAKASRERGGLGIVTLSGGSGIIMADKCEEYGVKLAKFMPETTSKLTELLPSFASVKNPVDVTAQAFHELDKFLASLNVLLEDKNVETVIFYMQIGHHLAPQLVPGLIEISKQTNKTLVVCWTGASKETKDALISGGVCWLPTPSRAIKAVKNFMQYQKNRETLVQHEVNSCEPQQKEVGPIQGVVTEFLGKQMISKYGISIPKGKLAKSAVEAVQVAEEIGYPVVLKVISNDFTHKSDVGGVIINLKSKKEVNESYHEIIKKCYDSNPSAKIDGILVEKMSERGTEVFIGCFQDPLFGPCIMFGLGGIYVEILKDVAVRKAPLTRKDAIEMIKSIQGYKILEGIRGQKPSDIEALVSTLVHVSDFCWDHRNDLKELDINPLIVYEEGKGVLALDTLIIGKALEPSNV